MFGLPWNTVSGIAGGVALLLWQFWPSLSAAAGAVKLPSLGGSSVTAEQAFAAVTTLSRFPKDDPSYKAVMAAAKVTLEAM